MRLLTTSLLCCLCSFLLAQAPVTAKNTPSYRWRIGLAGHHDNGYTDPYLYQEETITPRLSRRSNLQLIADYQIFTRNSAYRLTAEIARYSVRAGNLAQRQIVVDNRSGRPFFELIKMNYTHLGFGGQVEPLAKRRFSPYLGIQLQIAIPTKLDYSLYRFTSNRLDMLDQVTITGGQRVAVGYEISTGFRSQLTARWTASVGFYHSYLNFKAGWPPITSRPFPNGIMRLDGGGVELRCQFSI